MWLLCSHNSYNTCNVTFVKKSLQKQCVKKIPLQKTMLKEKSPPPITIGHEIFAPPSRSPPPPPAINNERSQYYMLGVTQWYLYSILKEIVRALLLLALNLTSQLSAHSLIWVKSSFSCFVVFTTSPATITYKDVSLAKSLILDLIFSVISFM